MQIFHWLIKVAHEQAREGTSSSASKQDNNITDQEAAGRDLVLYKNQRGSYRSTDGKKKSRAKNFRPFTVFLCRKDVAKACFHSTLNLKRVKSYNSQRHYWKQSVKMKKEDIACKASNNSNKVDSGSDSGNKVLLVSDTTLQSSKEKKEQKLKGDKIKTLSRMKDLLRWAATAKSEKSGKFIGRKALQFRNRAAIKTVSEDHNQDQVSNDCESPKISFRWEVESCFTTSSVSSGNDLTLNMVPMNSLIPAHDRKGNWITTDSEFVVLEL